MDKKQIGIFSGSFNPIHVGHLILANYVKEYTYLDEVWLVVSPQNPLKKAADLLDDAIRFEMVRLAVSDFSDIHVSDIELSMPRPSYTIDTLDKLKRENLESEFTLIVGGDSWNNIYRWKESERLCREYKILVYPRLGETIEIPEEFSETICLVNAPIVEISSTFIRNAIRSRKNVRAFVPPRVYDFIEERRLYR